MQSYQIIADNKITLLEFCFLLDTNELFRYRMSEFYIFGMQIKTIRLGSIQRITFDWSIKTLCTRSTNAQLVRSAGKRIKGNARLSHPMFEYFVSGNGRFAINLIHNLSRTIVGIRTKRQ